LLIDRFGGTHPSPPPGDKPVLSCHLGPASADELARDQSFMSHRDMRIGNSRADIRNVLAQVEQFGTEHRLSGAIVNDLNVALDEALSNIIAYGYASGAKDEIAIRLSCAGDEVSVEIEDGGTAFNPLQAARPDLTADLQERRIGGLGIHFVRSLMDQIAYDRVDGKNRLRMVKKTRPESTGP
jgi:anti-sigma regulatory factor (Ser/Thr protein kinase)